MSLKMTVEVTLKPGSNQSEAEAEAEFIKLFREYLTNEEGAFQCDYGPEAWGRLRRAYGHGCDSQTS